MADVSVQHGDVSAALSAHLRCAAPPAVCVRGLVFSVHVISIIITSGWSCPCSAWPTSNVTCRPVTRSRQPQTRSYHPRRCCAMHTSTLSCIASRQQCQMQTKARDCPYAMLAFTWRVAGLFAKCDIAAGTVVSFYHGVRYVSPGSSDHRTPHPRLPHAVVDARSWDMNQNTITLDSDVVIDVQTRDIARVHALTYGQVPRYENDTRHYTASLGHKANHSFDAPNAQVRIFSNIHIYVHSLLRSTTSSSTRDSAASSARIQI